MKRLFLLLILAMLIAPVAQADPFRVGVGISTGGYQIHFSNRGFSSRGYYRRGCRY